MLHRVLEKNRTLFEAWTHDAAAIPSEWFGHWGVRFERFRARRLAGTWWEERFGGDQGKSVPRVSTGDLGALDAQGELRVFDRGDRSVVDVYPGFPLDNDYSMNVADICPVGALTATIGVPLFLILMNRSRRTG